MRRSGGGAALAAVISALALILAILTVPTRADAAAISSGSCLSTVPWRVNAEWGDVGTTTPLKVSWTADAGTIATSWEVRALNSDGTIAQKYTANSDRFDYLQGTVYKAFDPKDPAGPTPRVMVWLGVTGGAAKCRVDLVPPAPPSPTPTPTPTEPTILFDDNFDGPAGTAPDPTKWRDFGPAQNPRYGFGGIKNSDTEHLDGNGKLIIPATPEAGNGLFTEGLYGVKYGTVNFRAQIPSDPGWWSAFWMENDGDDIPGDQVNLENRDRVEIDTHEGYTHFRNPSTDRLYGDASYSHALTHVWKQPHTQAWGTGDPYCSSPDKLPWGDRMHTYSTVITRDGKVTNYVDGVQCGFTADPALHPGEWPAYPVQDRKWHIILDLALGGACSPCQGKPLRPSQIVVDRVWVTDSETPPAKTN